MNDKTLRMYRFYCWINVAWYVLIGSFGLGTFTFSSQVQPSEDVPIESLNTLRMGGMLLLGIGAVFSVLAVYLMRQKITPKNWTSHFVNICLGISTCCLAPFCIYLAIAWNNPQFKESLGKQEFEI